MMSQRKRRRTFTSADDPLIDAAMDVMTDLGPTRLTMAEVARRAGVSRMTVYRRYRSHSELISAVLTAEMSQIVAEVQAETGHRGCARDDAVAQCLAVVSTLVDHTLLQRVLAVDAQSVLPLLVERLGSGQQLLRVALAGQLGLGMAGHGGDGSIRDADPELMSLTLLTMGTQYVIGMQALRAQYPQAVLLDELGIAMSRYLRSQ